MESWIQEEINKVNSSPFQYSHVPVPQYSDGFRFHDSIVPIFLLYCNPEERKIRDRFFPPARRAAVPAGFWLPKKL